MRPDLPRDELDNPIIPVVGLTRRGLMVNAGRLGLATMSMSALLTACARSGSGNKALDKIRKGGTLTFAIDGTDALLDPGVYTTLGDWMAVDSICSGLTNIDFITTAPSLDIASHIATSSDGLTLTFTVRAGVEFHDGSPLTAEDCVRTFTRQLFPGDKSLPAASTRPMRGSLNQNVAEVKTVGDSTFQMRLKQPDAVFLSRLTDIDCRIMSAASMDRYGTKVGEHLIGTGPFKLVSMTAQQSVTLEANTRYWKGSPVIDRLVLQQVTDPSALTAGIEGAQINASSFVAHSAAKTLKASPSVTVYNTSKHVDVFVMMNVVKPLLEDLRVRKAVNLCIDRAKIVTNAFFGYARVPDGYIISPGEIGYDPTLADLSEYNLTAAKQLITEAGATGKAVSLIAQNNNWYPATAQIIQANLTAIGLVPTLTLLDPGSYVGRFFDPTGHELALWERDSYIPDPFDSVGSMLQSTGSYAALGTGHATLNKTVVAELDSLLTSATQTSDAAVRKSLYTRAQRLFAEKFMAIAMVAYTQNIVVGRGCTDIDAPALAGSRMQMEKAALTS
jgi:peptide/nickel transport system substrate-binding protein